MVVNAHFKSDFNAVEYNWRMSKLTPEHLEKRNDKKMFAVIAKRAKTKEKMIDLLVSNYCKKGEITWIGELDEDVYEEWTKRIASLDYNFKEELGPIIEKFGTAEDFKKAIYDPETDKSEIFDALLTNKISMETFIVLDNMLGIMNIIDRQLEFTLLWQTYKKTIRKYQFIFNSLYLTPDDITKMRKWLKSQISLLIDSNGVPKKDAARVA